MSRPTQKQELVRPRAHLGYLSVGGICQKSDPMTTDEEGKAGSHWAPQSNMDRNWCKCKPPCFAVAVQVFKADNVVSGLAGSLGTVDDIFCPLLIRVYMLHTLN